MLARAICRESPRTLDLVDRYFGFGDDLSPNLLHHDVGEMQFQPLVGDVRQQRRDRRTVGIETDAQIGFGIEKNLARQQGELW